MARKTKETSEGPKAGDDLASNAAGLVQVRRQKKTEVVKLSAPSTSAKDGLKGTYVQALWRHARAKRLLSGTNEKVKSQEVALVEARRHRLLPSEVEEVQEDLAKALEARVEARADLDQRRGELKHAWEAYGAFEDQD